MRPPPSSDPSSRESWIAVSRTRSTIVELAQFLSRWMGTTQRLQSWEGFGTMIVLMFSRSQSRRRPIEVYGRYVFPREQFEGVHRPEL